MTSCRRSTSAARARTAGAAGVAALAILAAAAAAGVTGASVPAQRPGAPAARVAFVLTEGATMIDFAGPWEVFQDVMLDGHRPAYQLYTVGDGTRPIRTSGGMSVNPDYAFADAPRPDIVVVPAQRGAAALQPWLRKVHGEKAMILSVCTGAFQVAATGLLDGKTATTHHDFFDAFARRFPSVKLERGRRFVKSDEQLYTAGGLSSGIDLALHIVERMHGRAVAQRTADYMEYEGQGWKPR